MKKPQSPASISCPSCGLHLPETYDTCVSCQTNLRTGQRGAKSAAKRGLFGWLAKKSEEPMQSYEQDYYHGNEAAYAEQSAAGHAVPPQLERMYQASPFDTEPVNQPQVLPIAVAPIDHAAEYAQMEWAARARLEDAAAREEKAIRKAHEAAVKEQAAFKKADEAAGKEREALNKAGEAAAKEQSALSKAQEAYQREQEAIRRGQQAAAAEQEAIRKAQEAAAREQEAIRKAQEAAAHEQEAVKNAQAAAARELEAVRQAQEAIARQQEAMKKAQQAILLEQEATRRAQAASARELEAIKRAEEADRRITYARQQQEAAAITSQQAVRKQEEAARREKDAHLREQEIARRQEETAKKEIDFARKHEDAMRAQQEISVRLEKEAFDLRELQSQPLPGEDERARKAVARIEQSILLQREQEWRQQRYVSSAPQTESVHEKSDARRYEEEGHGNFHGDEQEFVHDFDGQEESPWSAPAIVARVKELWQTKRVVVLVPAAILTVSAGATFFFLTKGPDDQRLYQNGLEDIARHRFTFAVSELEQAAALKPKDPKIAMALAQAYLGIDQVDKAWQCVSQAQQEGVSLASVPELTGQMADFYKLRGQYDKAASLLRPLAQANISGKKQELADLDGVYGDQLVQDGKLEDAMRSWEEVKSLNAGVRATEAPARLATIYRKLISQYMSDPTGSKDEEALAILNKLDDQATVQDLELAAKLYDKSGKIDEEIEQLRKAAKLDAKDPAIKDRLLKVLNDRGNELIAEGKTDDGNKYLEQAKELDPSQADDADADKVADSQDDSADSAKKDNAVDDSKVAGSAKDGGTDNDHKQLSMKLEPPPEDTKAKTEPAPLPITPIHVVPTSNVPVPMKVIAPPADPTPEGSLPDVQTAQPAGSTPPAGVQ